MSDATESADQKLAKPDCYACVYRGEVPGSAHSSCNHPAFQAVRDNPMAALMAIFGSVGRVPPQQIVSDECRVVGNPHGIRRGWFNHPLNFDPVWLQSCTGFKERAP